MIKKYKTSVSILTIGFFISILVYSDVITKVNQKIFNFINYYLSNEQVSLLLNSIDVLKLIVYLLIIIYILYISFKNYDKFIFKFISIFIIFHTLSFLPFINSNSDAGFILFMLPNIWPGYIVENIFFNSLYRSYLPSFNSFYGIYAFTTLFWVMAIYLITSIYKKEGKIGLSKFILIISFFGISLHYIGQYIHYVKNVIIK